MSVTINTSISAVVMAGGFGSRLAPITNRMPKPLVPVFNRSAFERILDLLADNGFTNAAVTTMYLSEQIEAVKHEKINLSFFKENEPRGSAGAIRALLERLDDTVLILSGDAVCDFDLKKQIDKHKNENREATLLLTRTRIPQEFGTVLLEKSTNRITRFVEKPSWSDTLSNLINTGIYILNKKILRLIPEEVFFDFGRDFFPLLLQKKVPLYGEEAEGFWCDIGSFGDFYDCNMRFSCGNTIFGTNCSIHENAKIQGSVLFHNVTVGESKIDNSILCDGVIIGNHCVVPDGCILGANSVLGDRSVLKAGVKIADNIKIGKDSKIMGNVFIGSAARHLFGDDGINGVYGSEIDGEVCFKLGQGLTSLGKPAHVGIMNDRGENADLLADAMKIGVRSAGGILLELEDGFVELAAFAAREYALDCCVFIAEFKDENGENRISIRLFEKSGVYLCREKQRKAESAMREKLSAPTKLYPPELLAGEHRAKYRYCHYLQELTGQLGSVCLSVCGKNEQANFFISNARALGAEVKQIEKTSEAIEDTFLFDEEYLSAVTSEGIPLSFWQLFVFATQSGGRREVFLPQSTPETVEKYLNGIEIETHFYNDSDSEERKKAFETHFFNDKILLALLVCRFLRENMVLLDEAQQFLPPFFFRSIIVDIEDEEKADLIGSLAEECADCSRGVRLHNDKGSYAVFPRAEGGFRVLAEAVSAELAEELCDMAERKIKGEK